MNSPTHRPRGSLYSYIFALAFCALSIVPLFKSGISLALLPQDYFGREQLIEAFNTVRLRLGDRVFPQVLVGKQGWLYLYTTREVGDFQHAAPFTRKELVDYRRRIDAINASLQKRGITFLVVIPPDKATIYPQYMPDEIKVLRRTSRLDQFLEEMRDHGQTQVLDLRPALRQASKTQMVYYKTDAHYTHVAWYIAYREIMNALSKHYPELEPHPISDYKLVATGVHTMQLPGLMGLPYIKEPTSALVPEFPTGVFSKKVPLHEFPGQTMDFAINQDSSLPKLLILHDSFLLTVIPFLEPHFRETTAVFRNTDPSLWRMDWVDAEHPDVVILEFTEFYMNFMEMSIPPLQ
jgi:alginate O-acetyltransferase complex protein AlgJ